MSENVIESIVVQLGLDASGLNAEAAKEAIGNIQTSVAELNKALEETEKLLGKIGHVNQSQRVGQRAAPQQAVVPNVAPVATATESPAGAKEDKEEAAKKRREAAFQKWKGREEIKTAKVLRDIASQTTSKGIDKIISKFEGSLVDLDKAESSGNVTGHQARIQRGLFKDILESAKERRGVVVQAEADRKTEDDRKAEEEVAVAAAEKAERARQQEERKAQRQRDREARRKMPTSLGGLLRGIPGLGQIAAGLYIARQAFDAVAGFFGKMRENMVGHQDMRTAAQSFGIATDRMRGFTDAAVQFGANSNEIAQDMSKLMSGAQIPIGGQYHWGLARKGVAVSEGGQWRNMEDILGDLADVMSKEPKLNKDTYNYYRHMFGFSKQTVDFMQQGRAGIEAMRKDAIKKGLALDEQWVERGAEQAEIWNATGQELSVAAQKIGTLLSEWFTGTILGMQEVLSKPGNDIISGVEWVYDKAVGSPSHQTQSVRPDAQSIYHADNQKHSQQMTVNVSVDKSGAATTSVKGVDRKNVTTNIYPYKVAQ